MALLPPLGPVLVPLALLFPDEALVRIRKVNERAGAPGCNRAGRHRVQCLLLTARADASPAGAVCRPRAVTPVHRGHVQQAHPGLPQQAAGLPCGGVGRRHLEGGRRRRHGGAGGCVSSPPGVRSKQPARPGVMAGWRAPRAHTSANNPSSPHGRRSACTHTNGTWGTFAAPPSSCCGALGHSLAPHAGKLSGVEPGSFIALMVEADARARAASERAAAPTKAPKEARGSPASSGAATPLPSPAGSASGTPQPFVMSDVTIAAQANTFILAGALGRLRLGARLGVVHGGVVLRALILGPCDKQPKPNCCSVRSACRHRDDGQHALLCHLPPRQGAAGVVRLLSLGAVGAATRWRGWLAWSSCLPRKRLRAPLACVRRGTRTDSAWVVLVTCAQHPEVEARLVREALAHGPPGTPILLDDKVR